jgi:hypothetical protein
MAYWKRQRGPALNLGGMDGTGWLDGFTYLALSTW